MINIVVSKISISFHTYHSNIYKIFNFIKKNNWYPKIIKKNVNMK
jgi:hypothetical protein